MAKRWDLFSLGICTARVFAGAVRSFVLTNTFEHYKPAVQILDALHQYARKPTTQKQRSKRINKQTNKQTTSKRRNEQA